MTKEEIMQAKELVAKIKSLPQRHYDNRENQQYPCVRHGCDGTGGHPSYWIVVYLDANCKGVEIAGERPC
jgi:hypothetical protein